MIGSKNLCVDLRIFQPVFQAFGHTEIVDPPSCILFSRFESIRPPGVDSFLLRVKITKSIDETGSRTLEKFCTLFIGESGIFPIGFRVL